MKITSSLNPLLLLPIILFVGLCSSCSSSKKINPNYVYFQTGPDTVSVQQKETLIQPEDIIGIQVYSGTANQEQAAIFNIPVGSGQAGETTRQGYQVSPQGNINIPVIGKIKAAGLTKTELEALLVQKLADYVKNPAVIISLTEFKVSILGEVKKPGLQLFNAEKVTIIEALSAAGDLTDFGKREDVKVIRDQEGTKVHHTIDLRSTAVFNSPAYFLQPNDIVYVAPNDNKLKSLSVDPEKQRRRSLIITFIGVTVSVATLILTALR